MKAITLSLMAIMAITILPVFADYDEYQLEQEKQHAEQEKINAEDEAHQARQEADEARDRAEDARYQAEQAEKAQKDNDVEHEREWYEW